MLTHLESWGAISAVGDDKISYLQGQLADRAAISSVGGNPRVPVFP